MSSCNENCAQCPNRVESPFYAKYDKYVYSEEYRHPYAAIVSVTDACTNACPYCFVRFGTKRMSLGTAFQVCEFLIANAQMCGQTPSFTFFGGEPLMEFDEIICPVIEKYGDRIMFSITTNGVLLTPDKVDFLKEHQVTILLSFDGVKEVQDFGRPTISGESSYDLVVKNIPYLVQEMGANVTMRSTITKQSIPFLYQTFLLAKELQFTEWAFAVNAFETFTNDDTELLIKELDKICHDISVSLDRGHPILRVTPIIAHFNKLKELEQNPSYEIDNTLFRCGMATTGTGISPEGEIIPCQEKNSKVEFSIGNIWEGIDETRHKAYLDDYFNRMQRWNCEKPCPDKLKAICLNDLCPSRMQDLDQDYPSSAICSLLHALDRTTSRLYLKYAFSANKLARDWYFYDRNEPWREERNQMIFAGRDTESEV